MSKFTRAETAKQTSIVGEKFDARSQSAILVVEAGSECGIEQGLPGRVPFVHGERGIVPGGGLDLPVPFGRQLELGGGKQREHLGRPELGLQRELGENGARPGAELEALLEFGLLADGHDALLQGEGGRDAQLWDSFVKGSIELANAEEAWNARA